MDAYTGFARVYDLFMDNVPYQQWCSYICKVFREYGITDGPVLDLGCGTGELTRLMAEKGYDMTGVDSSPEMLGMALEKTKESEILYLMQQMQELELDGCVCAAYSSCDCLNYILEEEELSQAFQKVYQYLEKGGVFVFDMNTEYKYRKILGEGTFAESREEGSFIWENYYDEQTGINEYDLTLFIPEGNGLYSRYTETHFQKNYPVERVREILADAGFTCLGVYDDYTKAEVYDYSKRAVFVVQK